MDYMDYRMRYHLTRNRHLPFEALRVLTTDKWLWAQNPSTPPEVLERLGLVSDVDVRACVAQNPSTPGGVLEKMSADVDYSVRWYVAHNPNTTVSVLEKLRLDPSSAVREAAKRRLGPFQLTYTPRVS